MGFFSISSMGNILKAFWSCFKGDDNYGGDDDHYPYYRPTSRPHYQPQHQAASSPVHQHQPLTHGGVASLAQDLLNFEYTSIVPEGLGQKVTSSKKAQVKWYQNIVEAYKNTRPPPKTPAEAAQLVATALNRIQRADLEGVLAFYNLPFPSFPAASSSDHYPSSLPKGVQYLLSTLPVHNNCIGDGDGFTAYVDTTDRRESANVPLEVHEMVIARTQARIDRDYQMADIVLRRLDKAGYKKVCSIIGPKGIEEYMIITISGEEILARRYRIRMRGIDAPEFEMKYGKESKNALVKLIGGKCVKIYVYEQDRFGRYVGDIYCDSVFIQEQMLKGGHVWHFKAYDKRPELAQWEREASAANLGFWALENPQKPWDWRREQRNANIQVY